jgi:trk system potassium uptake protein TrkH
VVEQVEPLSYAARFRVLLRYSGQFSLVIGALTLLPLAVSLLYGDVGSSLRYGVLLCLLAVFGLTASRLNAPRDVQPCESLSLSALLFLLTPLIMSYPLMGGGLSFLDALFEAVSGITTTGLTTLPDVESMPGSFLFARAWMQWYGGLGIVVLSLALVVSPGIAAKGLFFVEGSEDDLVGGTRAFARLVLLVYVSITVCAIGLLLLLGVGGFNAIVYTLASVSTGGFSPHSGSLADLGGWTARTAVTLVCLSCSFPLVFYYRHRQRSWTRTANAVQVKTIVFMGLAWTLLLGFFMWLRSGTPLSQLVWDAPFMAFSAQTTSGFSVMDTAALEPVFKLLLMMGMMVGGGVGSTAGGFKVLRLLILFRVLQVTVMRFRLSKHAFYRPRLGSVNLSDREILEALLIIVLFSAVILSSWFAFVACGLDPFDSLFEVVSATGTVGLSSGITCKELPAFLKGVLCADMLLGRLEIVAWLVVVNPRTWLGRRR